MKKGRLLGKGLTAEVFEWGNDKILKLYFKNYDMEWAQKEADKMASVKGAGVDLPEVYGIVEVDGRAGLIFDFIKGATIFGRLEKEPWNLFIYTASMAELHDRIHKYDSRELMDEEERFHYMIGLSDKILEKRTGLIYRYLSYLPKKKSICHGDLHFNNIMISGNRLVPIDWDAAYRGNPMGDAARTCLIILSPGLAEGSKMPDVFENNIYGKTWVKYMRWAVFQRYISEYCRLSTATPADIDAWILPAAAAKLRDNIPGEKEWLIRLIDLRLAGYGLL